MNPARFMITVFGANLLFASACLAADYCITVPAGEYRVVAGNIILQGPAFTEPVELWNRGSFSSYYYDPDLGGWVPSQPMPIPNQGVVVRASVTGSTFCFAQPQTAVPPPTLTAGLNLVSCPSNRVAAIQEVLGPSLQDGMRVYRFNTGPGRNPHNFAAPDYTIYMFTGGTWTPSTPFADAAEALFVVQPFRLVNPKIVSGKMSFGVESPPGETITIEHAETLTQTVWQVLSNISGDGTVQEVVDDMNVLGGSSRYYRARISF